MDPSVLKAPEAAQTASNHFQLAVQHFFQVITDPNATESDLRDAGSDLWDACRDTGKESAEGLKEALRERFLASGWSEEQVGDWFDQNWERVKSLADRVHEAAPRVEKVARRAWVAGTAKLAAVAGVVGLLVLGYIAGTQNGQDARNMANQIGNAENAQKQAEQFERQERQFDNLIEALQTPVPDVQAPEPAQAVSPLPAAVAVVAAQPVQVTIKAPTGAAQTVTSSVAQVWHNIPASQPVIDHSAESAAQSDSSGEPHLHVSADVVSPLEDGSGGYITAHIETE